MQENCLERLRRAGHVEEVLSLASSCERFFELGVCERPLGLNRWHRGRVVLVGDSAHAMPPFLGQGANQGIQDAVCLADQLADANGNLQGLEKALEAYTAKRLLPVAVLALESNFLGQVETLPGPLGSLLRDNFFRVTGSTGVAGSRLTSKRAATRFGLPQWRHCACLRLESLGTRWFSSWSVAENKERG